MSGSAKQIKTKIASVKNVGKITKAMELVSVSKMKKGVSQLESTRPYAIESMRLLERISGNEKHDHPLLSHGDNSKNLVVVISSNRGLCGSYNARVAKGLTEYITRAEKKHGSEVECVCVGKYAETAARRLRKNILASFQNFDENTKYADTMALSEVVHELYITGNYWNVVIIYTDFISTLSSQVVARQILPVKPENVINKLDSTASEIVIKAENSEIIFEPTESEVLNFVLRRLTDAQIYHGLAESIASEHSSRMIAMKNATENASKLADDLQLSYNRARQSSITQEISEIASGAEAINN